MGLGLLQGTWTLFQKVERVQHIFLGLSIVIVLLLLILQQETGQREGCSSVQCWEL